jgi:hypothetical protein
MPPDSRERATTPISPESAVRAIVAASPGHRVQGKKRIHKTAFLCAWCDAPIGAHFAIRHFGVFSTEIADALDVLSFFGDLETQDEQVGPNQYFTTVYSLGKGAAHEAVPAISRVAKHLARYSTPSLEVASTVAYFMKQGWPEARAVAETARIKPAISTPERFAATRTLLKEIAGLRGTSHGQRPANP